MLCDDSEAKVLANFAKNIEAMRSELDHTADSSQPMTLNARGAVETLRCAWTYANNLLTRPRG